MANVYVAVHQGSHGGQSVRLQLISRSLSCGEETEKLHRMILRIGKQCFSLFVRMSRFAPENIRYLVSRGFLCGFFCKWLSCCCCIKQTMMFQSGRQRYRFQWMEDHAEQGSRYSKPSFTHMYEKPQCILENAYKTIARDKDLIQTRNSTMLV
jgi:hypothetical protein